MEEKRSPDEHGRRSTDRPEQTTWQHRFHIYAKENWYRDVWMIILTVVIVFTVKSAQDTSSEASKAASSAKAAAVQAKFAVSRVQAERKFSIRSGCQAQNKRHSATVNELKALTKQPPRDIKLKGVNQQVLEAFNMIVRAQRAQSVAPTILLIDALVPKQDCNSLVIAATSTSKAGHS